MLDVTRSYPLNQLDALQILNVPQVKHAETDNALIHVSQRTLVLHLRFVQLIIIDLNVNVHLDLQETLDLNVAN